MATAELLAKMTDPAQFEAIGSAFLRSTYPHLKLLLDLGTNPSGKTRTSRLDGFCRYQKDKYAAVEYTTNASNPGKKWLYEGEGALGDLPKVIRKINEIRSKHPAAHFEVYLVTNQPVTEDLAQKVYDFPTPDETEVIIIENTILRHFLDADPVGQYVRREFLKIEATQLSLPLLREITEKNLEHYRYYSAPNDSVADIKTYRDLLPAFRSYSGRLLFLVGESGLGKSTLLYQFMAQERQAGNIVLHLYAEAITSSFSVSQAILWQLKTEAPHLQVTEDVLLRLLTGEIILVVDDINKDAQPQKLIDKLILWSTIPASLNARVLCPVWPKNMSVSGYQKENKDHYTQLQLPPLTEADSLAIIEQKTAGKPIALSRHQKIALIKDLGKDPLLLTIFLENVDSPGKYDARDTLDTLSKYLARTLSGLADRNQTPVFPMRQALEATGQKMLANRDLQPSYNLLQRWFSREPATLSLLDSMSADKQIFRFSYDGSIFFRHDRIRDAILIESTLPLLESPEENRDVLSDPYFAELIGSALAKIEMKSAVLASLVEMNPLSVFASLKYLQGDNQREKYSTIREAIAQWNSGKHPDLLREVAEQTGSVLVHCDIREIDFILARFPHIYEISLCKFRSGSLEGALHYFMLGEAASPSTRNYWRDIVIEHVRQQYGHSLATGLTELNPAQFTVGGRVAAYRLAGCLRDPRLFRFTNLLWVAHQNQEQYADYLFAVVHCSGASDQSALEEALGYWLTFATEKKEHQKSVSLSDSVSMYINHTQWNLSAEQVIQLVELARKNKVLRKIVSMILAYVNLPAALEYITEYFGEIIMSSAENGHIRLFIDIERWDLTRYTRQLSGESMDLLRELWTNKKKSAGIREIAFRYWSGNADPTLALPLLRKVRSGDETLFHLACQLRVDLGDKTVLPTVIRNIEKTVRIWGIQHIWNEQLSDYILNKLEDPLFVRNGYFMDQFWELLPNLPAEDAEKFLVGYWPLLKKWPTAIGTALLLSTPKTLALAAQEINRLGFDLWSKYQEHYSWLKNGTIAYASGSDPFTGEEHENINHLRASFDHIHQIFGITRIDRTLTERQLYSLVPYLDLLDDVSLAALAQGCSRKGWTDFLDRYLLPLLDPASKKALAPSDADLLEEISAIGSKHLAEIYYLVEEMKLRGLTRERIFLALRKFSATVHAMKDLQAVCLFLKLIGTRKDLDLLDPIEVSDAKDPYEVAKIKGGTRFIVERRSLS